MTERNNEKDLELFRANPLYYLQKDEPDKKAQNDKELLEALRKQIVQEKER